MRVRIPSTLQKIMTKEKIDALVEAYLESNKGLHSKKSLVFKEHLKEEILKKFEKDREQQEFKNFDWDLADPQE